MHVEEESQFQAEGKEHAEGEEHGSEQDHAENEEVDEEAKKSAPYSFTASAVEIYSEPTPES